MTRGLKVRPGSCPQVFRATLERSPQSRAGTSAEASGGPAPAAHEKAMLGGGVWSPATEEPASRKTFPEELWAQRVRC